MESWPKLTALALIGLFPFTFFALLKRLSSRVELPSEAEINEAFADVLTHMTNIPAAAARALPLAKKWRIVQEYRATKKDEPDEFIAQITGQESDPSLAELSKMNMPVFVAQQSVEWKNKFCRRGGLNHLFLVLAELISNAKAAGAEVDASSMSVVSQVPVVLELLLQESEGLQAVTENSQSMQILVRSLDFVDTEAQRLIFKLLLMVFERASDGRGAMAVMTALDQFVEGSTYWAKLVRHFEGSNVALMIEALNLIRVMLSASDRQLKTRVAEILTRNELVPALDELAVSCEDLSDESEEAVAREAKQALAKDIADFQTFSAEIFVWPRPRTMSNAEDELAVFAVKAKPQQKPQELFSALDAALTVNHKAYQNWHGTLANLMLLEKDEHVWNHLELLTDSLVSRDLAADKVDSWFKGVLQSYVDTMEGVKAAVQDTSAYEKQIDDLHRQIDDLAHQLEDATRSGGPPVILEETAVEAPPEAPSGPPPPPPPAPPPPPGPGGFGKQLRLFIIQFQFQSSNLYILIFFLI